MYHRHLLIEGGQCASERRRRISLDHDCVRSQVSYDAVDRRDGGAGDVGQGLPRSSEVKINVRLDPGTVG